MISGFPVTVPAMYDNGERSPDAEILPRRGTTGVIPLEIRAFRDSMTFKVTAE